MARTGCTWNKVEPTWATEGCSGEERGGDEATIWPSSHANRGPTGKQGMCVGA